MHYSRAATAPFLAAKEMGLDTFKWVLYGDDDTVFFIDGALDALENLDYNMPYLLSDDVWFVEDDGEHCAIPTSHPSSTCVARIVRGKVFYVLCLAFHSVQLLQ